MFIILMKIWFVFQKIEKFDSDIKNFSQEKKCIIVLPCFLKQMKEKKIIKFLFNRIIDNPQKFLKKNNLVAKRVIQRCLRFCCWND